MPRWPLNEQTGRTVENRKAHPDGVQCPSCKFNETKFRYLNNKKNTQPRYQCLKCNEYWTHGGKTRAPYNTRRGAVHNHVVADPAAAALQLPAAPPAAASQPPAAPAVRPSQRNEVNEVDPEDQGLSGVASLFIL